jgi:hypothetical protein
VRESTIDRFIVPVPQSRNVMTEILRAGAQKMLTQMIQQEVDDWLAERASLLDEQGHRQVVRNGFLPKRKITTGVGQVEVQQPRVRDRRPADQAEPFTSKILPPYLRKAKSIEELIPWLYLKGVSTGDFSDALRALGGIPESHPWLPPLPGLRTLGLRPSKISPLLFSRSSLDDKVQLARGYFVLVESLLRATGVLAILQPLFTKFPFLGWYDGSSFGSIWNCFGPGFGDVGAASPRLP